MKQKGLRKLVSMILAVVMVLAMSITGFAGTTITMSDTTSSYSAYKLMSVTVSGEDEDGNPTNYAYTVNSTYLTAIAAGLREVDSTSTITNASTNAEIVAAIAALKNDSDKVRTFVDAVYASINGDTLEADYTASSGVFSDVDYGYYLIVETAEGSSGTYSLVMLDTADQESIEVSTKEGSVELTKKVMDTNDSTGENSDYQDTADYDIGDSVPFRLTGTVDSYIDSYDTYYYAFHDVMSEGLSFNRNSVVVKIDGVVVTGGYEIVTEDIADGCSFEIVFDDLKSCSSESGSISVSNTSSIVVEFTATLTDDADLGNTGNPNTACVEYSNNVYDSESTGTTTWDTVVVYTYQVIINKVIEDENEESGYAALEGAGFALYKYDYVENDYVAVGDELIVDEDSNPLSTFTFSGLDDGDYKLVETTVPNGYNAIDAMYFTISATHGDGVTPVSDLTQIGSYLTELSGLQDESDLAAGAAIKFTADTGLNNGSLSANVINTSGSELPSTGGMGTTIFHIIGSIMALGAVVLLVTRVRIGKNE